ncbi:PaaI family thioesterase [Zavarzinia sp. CC-PAN008]|uniref:PaaI family thioesterase n=1 Tax=Zavarzinia sp. CC-PAN008 TaxID=3243332 RepID=UPI003F742A51
MTDQMPGDIAYMPFGQTGGFIGHNGPYFWGQEPSGEYIYGFQSDERHGNPNGVLHGGAVTAFVDTFLGHAVVAQTGRMCATIALNVQFVAGATAGGWVSGRARIRKLTRTMAFLEAEASAGDTLLLTATSIFRVFDAR